MFNFFKKNTSKSPANTLYQKIVAQARCPDLYLKCLVPDNIEGRLSMVYLHAFLILHRLDDERQVTGKFKQQLFDTMFQDMELSLREQGIGDQGIPHRIKKMMKHFYGCAEAYEESLKTDDDTLTQALYRNVYLTTDIETTASTGLLQYVTSQKNFLAQQKIPLFMSADVTFKNIEEVL